MKTIIKVFLYCLIILILCYLAASIISATFDIAKMTQSTREGIVGAWVGIIVLSGVIYLMSD